MWKSKVISRNSYINNIEYEKIDASKIQITKRQGIKNAKVQMIFQLDKLNFKELNAFRLFNQYFGEGVNSVLFDALRTKNSLVYDVITRISNENYIKMYKITFTTSKENVNKAVELVMNLIKEINLKDELGIRLESLIKSYKLKRLFREEQSIILAKELATYDTMFGDYKIYENELGKIDEITEVDILNSAKKVLKNSAVQVVW